MKKTFLFFTTIIFGFLVITSCKKDEVLTVIPDENEVLTVIPDEIISGDDENEIFTNNFNLPGIELLDGLTGYWEVIENTNTYTLSDSLSPTCQFTGELLGQYKLRWTVTNGKDEIFEDVLIDIIGFQDNRDNEKYRAVKIGSQVWMAENLNYDAGEGSWIYDEDTSLAIIYGRLYNWESACQACPDGWHLPSDEEWKELEIYLGMSPEEADEYSLRGTNEGGKLKETGTSHWEFSNIGATDSVGFTALPAGSCFDQNGHVYYQHLGELCYFWSSTESVYRHLMGFSDKIYRNNYDKYEGFSVRCVKD
jgi:uncharacterized protein (TIGR02145 family)